jgi:hypothetical protein
LHFRRQSPPSRCAVAEFAKRQFPRLFSPRLCQYGGASRLSRRFLWRKIRNAAPFPLLPAVRFGDNFANSANFNATCNTLALATLFTKS